MISIPPLEVRRERPCQGTNKDGSDECIFLYGSGIGSNGEWSTICNLDQFVDNLGYSRRGDRPCDSNLTKDEMQKFIQQFISIERISLSPEVSARIKAVIDKHKQEQHP